RPGGTGAHGASGGRTAPGAPRPGPGDRAPAGRHRQRRTGDQAAEEAQAAAEGPDRLAGERADTGRTVLTALSGAATSRRARRPSTAAIATAAVRARGRRRRS